MNENADASVISVVNPVCCGMDIHKKSISATLITTDDDGKERRRVREFGTFTDDLIRLREWLLENECPIVAMESTGIYWRPIHNVLERFMRVILVNARHIKNVPGRKTDISDSDWIAGLLRYGLLRGSFIPEKEVREWRDLARLRRTLTESLADYKRRTHKLFETANIKIGSVVSDLFGVTGRNLIALLCDANTELSLEDIGKCARGSLRGKTEELHRGIAGFFEDHHRFQLKGLMRIVMMLENEIALITERLAELMSPHRELVDRLDAIPGINVVSAQSVLSEVGTTLEEFPTDGAFSSWSGLCPGNNESAGIRKDGKNSVFRHPFKKIMIEIAWAAIKKKGSYYKDKYYRLKARRGAKKAIVAIAHRLAKAIFHIIKFGDSFREPKAV